MGRRRKRRKKKVKKGLKLPPRYFQCPVCGSLTLTIDFKKSSEPGYKIAVARCGTCGLHCVMRVRSNLERIDVYNTIVDMAYENRLDECRPKEEEVEKQIEDIIREEEQYAGEPPEAPAGGDGGE